MSATPSAAKMTLWQCVTGAALLVGYSGYYICRSNLSVALPAVVADPEASVDRASIGFVISAGIVAYAVGKTVTGVVGDFFGGRGLFLGGLFLSVAATLAFSASAGATLFLLCWTLNRFAQSAGWGGLTKTAAHWYPAGRYGTVMSVLSLSFLFGDAAGRWVLGSLMAGGLSWRELFVFSAAVLASIGLVELFVLHGSPTALGLAEPTIGTESVFGASGASSAPESLRDLLLPYLGSVSFWLVCTVAFGMTLIRETFNTWIPSYLVDAHHLAPGVAARYSALFPFVGGVSALAVGALTDRTGSGNRVALMVPTMGACALSLGALAVATTREDLSLSLVAIAATALCLLGPYTLLAGAIAMDLGGRKGSATAAGLIDTAGYVGGSLSGWALGALAERGGWTGVFHTLALLAVFVTLTAIAYCMERRRRAPWRTGPAVSSTTGMA